MSFHSDLYDRLDANLSEPIYPQVLPQDATLPAITYTLVTERFDRELKGTTTLQAPSVQFSCWAATHDAAIALATSLLALFVTNLTSFQGAMGATTVQSVSIDDRRDGFHEETSLYRVDLDMTFTVAA